MSKTKGSLNKSGLQPAGKPTSQPAGKYSRMLFWLVILAAATVLVVRNIGVFGNVLKVVIGFGSVVIIHEFGHFTVAKLSGIKVEAFSIFMPPTLLGVRKTKKGFRFRFLPELFAKKEGELGGEQPGEADKKAAEAEETEYRIGLIPFGGFVKMLGQDDIGPVKESDDPRSFANKPVGTRMGVITAGVVFNALSAILIFMIVFLVGIKLPPAVVGGVLPDSPAEQAGLRPGDEVIEIADESKDIDFSNIRIAAALSDVNEAIALKVKHENGSIEDFVLVAEEKFREPLIAFGILQAANLTIAEVSEPNRLYSKTGLLPGDCVRSVNGKDISTHWELTQIVQDTLAPAVTLSAERTKGPKKGELVNSEIELEWLFATSYKIESESELYHIYSMVPRLQISSVPEKRISTIQKVICWLDKLLIKMGLKEEVFDTKPHLQKGDIILSAADVENPTYKELRNIVVEYENKELPISVLRIDSNEVEKTLTVGVEPKRLQDVNWVQIGINLVLDAEHAVVAKTIDTEGGPEKLQIPRGAKIMAVDGAGVSNFYDVIREIRKYPGERITLDWRLDADVAGSVALNVDNSKGSITVKSDFAEFVPFEDLKRVYKATGPINAVVMGYRKTLMFITQTYLTLKRLIAGIVSPKNLMGPVGIIAMSYQVVAHQPLIYYLYLLGLISAVIAVFNFLPLPPLDGGLIVLMVVEKIKGSALSERTQGVIAYAGWMLIGALILYITFNDIVRIFSG